MFIVSEISPQFGADLELAEQMILQSRRALFIGIVHSELMGKARSTEN